jgi:large subunit ribosomal protein L30
MMSFKSKRKFTRFALAATLGMAMVMGCAGTFAHAADDDDDELLDTKIFKGILKGLGLRKVNQIVERPDTPVFRGMVNKVPHLLMVVE